MSAGHRFGVLVDVWVMPAVFLLVLFGVGKFLQGTAAFVNVLWVMLWSQLPVFVLSGLSIVLEAFGLQTSAPLLNNNISFDSGLMLLDPPLFDFNFHGLVYFILSSVLFLWSFQILLSALAAVQGITIKRAMWFLTVSMIALILIRLPLTLVLGDRDLLDVLGLTGIVEMR